MPKKANLEDLEELRKRPGVLMRTAFFSPMSIFNSHQTKNRSIYRVTVLCMYLIKSFCFSILLDVPDDILERLKWLKEGLDAINKWKDEVMKKTMKPFATCTVYRNSVCIIMQLNKHNNFILSHELTTSIYCLKKIQTESQVWLNLFP